MNETLQAMQETTINDTRVHCYEMKNGITRTPEFQKKRLATHAINIGTKCGHDCLYCNTGSMLRMHESFKKYNEDPFGFGYAIIDPSVLDRVAKDAKHKTKRGMVQLCTVVDAWAPEAHEAQLGIKCLRSILAEPGWTVRILSKNVSLKEDLSFMQSYRRRILVGMSITGTPDKSEVIQIVEKNASSLEERMSTMQLAAAMGLRTYAMFCPLLPGIADSPRQIDQLVQFAVECEVEEIFVEPVNPRGRGLILCQAALELWGYETEAQAIETIRKKAGWSQYVVNLVKNTQRSVRKYSNIAKLRFLVYPKHLMPQDLDAIIKDDQGMIWL